MRPQWLVQDEYEKRNRLGFVLERVTKDIDGLAGTASKAAELPRWWR